MEIIPQLILNGVIAGAIYSLVALGFNLIYGTVKFFNLSHGVFAAVGGYGVYFLTNSLGLNLFLSVFIAVIASGSAGFIVDRLVFLRLRRKKASNLVLLVASLGVLTTTQAVISIIFTSQFQTLKPDAPTEDVYHILGGSITAHQVVILASGALALLILVTLIDKTGFGKAVKAISDDPEVARIVGIDVDKMTGYVFFIGSAIAGLGGILAGLDTGIEPSMGMALLLKGIIASIIGGVGSVYGGFVGSFVLGLVENFGIWKIPGQWKDAIAFGLLIAFLLIRPQGIIKR